MYMPIVKLKQLPRNFISVFIYTGNNFTDSSYMLYILKQLPIEHPESKQIPCDYKIIGKCIRLYCKSLYSTKIKTTTNQLSFFNIFVQVNSGIQGRCQWRRQWNFPRVISWTALQALKKTTSQAVCV